MAYNNAARKNEYSDEEDYRPTTAQRRSSPNVPFPTFREVGTGGQITRQSAPPPPLPGAAPRRPAANLPAPGMYGYAEENTRRMPPVRPQMPQPASHRPAAPQANPLSRINLSLNGKNLKFGLMVAGIIGMLIVSYLVVSFAVHTWQVWQDDMTYGRPRITRLETNVGHNETGGAKTIFIAQNINGQISITEFPGGDPTKTRVIVGPTLFGKERELVPVKLQVKDVNGDGQPDLLASADNQTLLYINENGNFRQSNEQERARYKALDREDNK